MTDLERDIDDTARRMTEAGHHRSLRSAVLARLADSGARRTRRGLPQAAVAVAVMAVLLIAVMAPRLLRRQGSAGHGAPAIEQSVAAVSASSPATAPASKHVSALSTVQKTRARALPVSPLLPAVPSALFPPLSLEATQPPPLALSLLDVEPIDEDHVAIPALELTPLDPLASNGQS